MRTWHSKLPVVAILVDAYSAYVKQFIDPISRKLIELGYGVIVVAGTELKHDVKSKQPTYNEANRIFSVAKSYDVTGYIILTGCVVHNMRLSETDAFVREFTHLPVVSLGVNVPSASSVCIDNKVVMRELMNHVTADSRRQRIVFIRGRENNRDSMERENVFRDVLREKGIPIKEHFFLTGNFSALDAFNEMDSLLSRCAGIDVVVAANDDMAASATRALRKHKYKIPADVLVAGFDDSPKARDTSPPLTSVVQPIDEQIVATVETLVSLMTSSHQRLDIYPTQRFDCQLRVRESTMAHISVVQQCDVSSASNVENAVDLFMDEFIADNAVSILGSGWRSYEILFHLVRIKLQTKGDLYEHTFSSLLKQEPENIERDLVWWRDFEVIFSKFVLGMSRTQRFSALIPSLIEMQTQLRELTWSLNNDLQFNFGHGTLLQTRLQTMLAKCDDLVGIKDVLSICFGHFGVKRAFLVLYKSTGGSVDCVARLSYIYSSDGPNASAVMASCYKDFESRNILPKNLIPELSSGTLLLNPLYHDEVQLGYLLSDPEDVSNLNFEYLINSLSNALRNCLDLSPSMAQDDGTTTYSPTVIE